jgi:uncharacterized membrane protein
VPDEAGGLRLPGPSRRPGLRRRSRTGRPSGPRRLLRRRLDGAVLRWQARLDRPVVDRTLPWLIAAVLFVVLAAPALARVRSLEPSETLARFTQAVTMLHDHRSDRITLTPAGVASPQSLAGLDGSLALYPLGYVLGFLPARSSLVLLQSGALAVAVVPLWQLARTVVRLRVGATAALAAAYGLYPPLHALGLDGFDPLALAVPLLLALVVAAHRGHVVRLAVVAAALLLCSSRLALVLVVAGVVLAVTVRPRAGWGLATVAALTAVAAQFAGPFGAGDGVFVDGEAFPPGTASALEVLARAVGHPAATLATLGERRVLTVAAALLLPVALLPLAALRHLAPAVPLQLAYLLGDLPSEQLRGPLAAVTIPFVFVAATFALARFGRAGTDRVLVAPRLSATLVGVAALFFVLEAATSPYERPWTWGGRDRFDGVRAAWAQEALAEPDDVIVAVTADVAPLLAQRRAVCLLPLDRYRCPGEPGLYLVDRTLDPTTGTAGDLQVETVDGDGRLVRLRPGPIGAGD